MKKIIVCLVIALSILATASLAQNIKYGTLNIHSEITGVEIYVDGELKGKDMIKLKEIQAGSHLIKAIQGDKVIYNKVVEIPEGNFITVVIKGQAGETKVKEVPPTKEATKEVEEEKTKEETPPAKKEPPGSTISLGSHSQKLNVYSSSIEATGTGLNFETRGETPSWYGASLYSGLDYANTSYSISGVDFTSHLASVGTGLVYRLTLYDDLRFILTGGVNYSYVASSGGTFTANGGAIGYEYGAGFEFGNFALAAEYSITSPNIAINGVAPFSSAQMDFRTTSIRLGWMY